MRAARSILVLLPLLAGCGGSPFFAEVELPRVCKSLPDQALFEVPEALPLAHPEALAAAAAEVGAQTVLRRFRYPLGAELPSGETQAHLVQLSLTARPGAGGFDFIDSARLELVAPEGRGLPTAALLLYERGTTPAGSQVVLTGEGPDVMPYLGEKNELHLALALTGRLPTQSVRADIEACASFKTRVPLELPGQ